MEFLKIEMIDNDSAYNKKFNVATTDKINTIVVAKLIKHMSMV